MILIERRIHRRDRGLAERVVERRVDLHGCEAEARSGIAIYHDRRLQPGSLLIAVDVTELKEDLQKLPEDPNQRALETRMEKYTALKDKVENYELLLSGTADDLKKELQTITESLRRHFL